MCMQGDNKNIVRFRQHWYSMRLRLLKKKMFPTITPTQFLSIFICAKKREAHMQNFLPSRIKVHVIDWFKTTANVSFRLWN